MTAAKWTEPTPTTYLATLTLEGQPVEVSYIVDECDDDGGTEWLLDLVKIGGAWVAAVDALSTQFCMVLQEALRAEEAAFYGEELRRNFTAMDAPLANFTEDAPATDPLEEEQF